MAAEVRAERARTERLMDEIEARRKMVPPLSACVWCVLVVWVSLCVCVCAFRFFVCFFMRVCVSLFCAQVLDSGDLEDFCSFLVASHKERGSHHRFDFKIVACQVVDPVFL